MDQGFMFSSSINIWDVHENEKVKTGIGTCRDLLIIPIYGPCGVENCIVVLIESMNEDCGKWKLFFPVLSARYYRSIVGMEVFWPYTYLSMNDEVIETVIK
jgi:hypothetical protein